MTQKLKHTSRVIAFVVSAMAVLSASDPILALSFEELSMVEIVHYADLIVEGKAVKRGRDTFIEITRTLKGPKHKEIKLSSTGSVLDTFVHGGDVGFFCIYIYNGQFHISRPQMVHPAKAKKKLELALVMWKDPQPFLDLSKNPENIDIIYVLGQSFSRYEVTCKELPGLAREFRWYYLDYYNDIPWGHHRKVSHSFKIQVKGDPNFNEYVCIADPKHSDDPLVDFMIRHIQRSYDQFRADSEDEAKLPTRFTLTLDLRPPAKVGALTYDQAIAYLYDRFKSKNNDIVRASLQALMWMCDNDSVTHVLQLLDHKNDFVRVAALSLLLAAKDPQTVPTLIERIADADYYPHLVAEILNRIGDPKALPALKEAARRGNASAYFAIGDMGTADCFEILINQFQIKKRDLRSIHHALTIMVGRSNLAKEDWMYQMYQVDQVIPEDPKWQKWWAKNKAEFKIVTVAKRRQR